MTDPTCGNCHADLPRWWAHYYCDACLEDVFAVERKIGRELDGAHPTPLAETGEERERRRRASNRQAARATRWEGD